jgi:hypothetical protein
MLHKLPLEPLCQTQGQISLDFRGALRTRVASEETARTVKIRMVRTDLVIVLEPRARFIEAEG